MSELLDRFAGGAGPGHSGPASAFDRFLDRLVPGEPPADDFDRALLYGALGSVLTLAAAGVLALLPSRDSILGMGFFVVGRRTLANVMGVAGDAALPVAALGTILLLATGAVALAGRRDGFTGALCVAQPVVGVVALGGSGLGWIALLAIIAVNLAIWAVVVVLLIAAAIAFLAALAGTALDG